MVSIVLLGLSITSHLSFASAFSFSISNTPQQCQNLTLAITGSGGTPPYSAVVIPYGATTLPNNTEVRKILDEPFIGDTTTASFQLKYPENSQFVIVVSYFSFIQH